MQPDSVDLEAHADDVVEPPQRGPIAVVSGLIGRDEERADRRVTVAETAALFAAVAVGALALVSLIAAHLHHHRPWIVWPVSLAMIALAAMAVWRWDRPSLRLDRAGLLPVVVGAGIACLTMFPGFQYATGDRDPGGYIQHAVVIERTGSIDFNNDLLANHLPTLLTPGAVWPAMWVEPGHPSKIFPQFYHLWPALLASAKGAGGYTGLFNTGPLLAVLCVVFATCIGRRLAGWPGAWTGAALLSTNMLEVWQAKYPSAEIFGQFLFLAATLGVVIAIQSGWRTAAAIGGTMIGLTYLERPDGIVLVLISWAGLAALLAARRFDARAGWFAGGMIALLPYGFIQAYHLASKYTLVNGVPTFPKVLAGMLGLAAIAAALSWQRSAVGRVVAWSAGRRARFGLSAVFVLLCAALMVIGLLRPKLFGRDFVMLHGARSRTFDEISLIRLSWFFSLTGLMLMGTGIAFIALRKWRLDGWVVALPAVALLTLYCYHVRNSAYMMWATRRFVPTVVPGVVLLIGCGIALIVVLIRRRLPAVLAALTAAAILVGLSTFYLSQSRPLHRHNENGRSVEAVQQIASVAGGQKGIFLWQSATYCCAFPSQLFGGPLFTIADQSSAPMPTTPALVPSTVTTYVAYAKATGRPLFFIADRDTPPPVVAGVRATKVRELIGVLPHWEETFVSRPKKTHDYNYHVTIYRLTAN